jgi:hypothetical protein
MEYNNRWIKRVHTTCVDQSTATRKCATTPHDVPICRPTAPDLHPGQEAITEPGEKCLSSIRAPKRRVDFDVVYDTGW